MLEDDKHYRDKEKQVRNRGGLLTKKGTLD